MTQTTEPRQNSVLSYGYHLARGISVDSQELSKTAQHSFDTFFKLSEVTSNYSPAFRQDTKFGIDKVVANRAFNNTLEEVYNLLTWQDDWNGYGASAPRLDAILYATSWISNFYTLVTDSDWSNPNVTAGAQGEVVFEWWNGPKKLTVYVSDQNAEYVQVWGPDIYTDMADGDAKSIEVCRELWAWLRV